MNRAIESAFRPGSYISYYEGGAFVSGLRHVGTEIAKLAGSDPTRAATLYETLLAGCEAKAEEIDDSDGELGMLADDLFGGWIRARQAAGADCDDTARRLLKFMDEDSYGFSDGLERSAPKILDRRGLAAFERAVRARFDKETEPLRWRETLMAIYSEQHDAGKYIELAERTGCTKADCCAIAEIFQVRRKPGDALAWVERGLKIDNANAFDGCDNRLREVRRAVLATLGRGAEALDSAWAEFQARPGKSAYEELLRYVPRTEREAWHRKAMEISDGAALNSVIELWLAVKETERLAARLERTSDEELEQLSHYVTEPAAERVNKTHPGAAAKVFRALCMRVVNKGKSKYYADALSNLEKAKKCYERAGLHTQWLALAAEIRRSHHRKSGFMPGFERIVKGAGLPGRSLESRGASDFISAGKLIGRSILENGT
jgi:hypothetical protein